jgi:hypothetical protein
MKRRNVRFTRCPQLSLGNFCHSQAKSSFSQDFLAKTIIFSRFFRLFLRKADFYSKNIVSDNQTVAGAGRLRGAGSQKTTGTPSKGLNSRMLSPLGAGRVPLFPNPFPTRRNFFFEKKITHVRMRE